MGASLLDWNAWEPPAHRVKALAGVLAGFQWPGEGRGFDALPKRRQALVLDEAREVLRRLHAAEDDS